MLNEESWGGQLKEALAMWGGLGQRTEVLSRKVEIEGNNGENGSMVLHRVI